MLKRRLHNFIAFLNKSRRKWISLGLLGVSLAIPLNFLLFSGNSTDEEQQYWKEFQASNRKFSVMLPKRMDFAGEVVPLSDFTVMESLEREFLVNTYFHSQTILMHKRAHRWLPLIASILKKNGVPEDFKYIPLIESNLSNVVSPKGATGFWQFMEGAGKQYGLEINNEIDERCHIEKSTEAACKYLKEAYRAFNNWTLAAASYNVGIEGLKKQMDKQSSDSYYDLSLNSETARYVFRILAVKEIIGNPKKYGFMLRKQDLYPEVPFNEVVIDSSVTDFGAFAKTYNISYKILKEFNPWLKTSTLANKEKKTYRLQIPKEGYDEQYRSERGLADSVSLPLPSAPDTLNKE